MTLSMKKGPRDRRPIAFASQVRNRFRPIRKKNQNGTHPQLLPFSVLHGPANGTRDLPANQRRRSFGAPTNPSFPPFSSSLSAFAERRLLSVRAAPNAPETSTPPARPARRRRPPSEHAVLTQQRRRPPRPPSLPLGFLARFLRDWSPATLSRRRAEHHLSALVLAPFARSRRGTTPNITNESLEGYLTIWISLPFVRLGEHHLSVSPFLPSHSRAKEQRQTSPMNRWRVT